MSPTPTTPTLPGMATVKSPTSKLPPTSIPSTPIATVANPVKQLTKEINEKMNISGDELTKEEFDVKTFTSAIIKTNVLSEHLSNLSQSINRLDKEIREEVSKNHEDLLHQAINIETLEDMLEMIQTRIHSLKSTSERLRLKISLPFDELNLRIRQLSRLQAACDTLRRIKGILGQSAKLRVHMQAGVRDIVKSAQCLNELDFLLRNFDHAGIDVIENDVHFAFKSRREVEEQAQMILDRSLAHMDHGQIGTSLQVFYSLGILNQKLVDTLKTNEKSFQKLSTDLLNTTNLTLQSTNSSSSLHTSASTSVLMNSAGSQFPGRSNMPNVGSMGQFRAQLWINFEKLMDNLYDSCSQVVQLQQILEKKKDLITNVFYIDEIDFSKIYSGKMYLINSSALAASSSLAGTEPPGAEVASVNSYDSICTVIDINEINSKKSIEFLYDMWRRLTTVLSTQLQSASSQSNYIKQTFQNEYPRLLKLQNDLWLRLTQLNGIVDRYRYPSQPQSDKSSSKSSSLPSATTNFQSAYELLRKCFSEFENSYLNRSLSHLFDPINLIYSSSQSLDKQINRSDMDSYIRGVQSQLQTLQYDMFNSSLNTSKSVATQSSSQSTGYVSVFSDKVVGNICKSIQMFANKGEQYLNSLNSELQSSISQNSSNNSSQSAGKNNIFFQSGLTTGLAYQIQMKNLDYLNATHDLHEQLVKLFDNESNLNKKLGEKLRQALKSLTSFEENALKPFVMSASECILAIMLTMHQEDFNNIGFSSLYIKELQQVLQRICRDYLQQYACKTIIQGCMNQLASRSIELFIRHAAILRPMTDVSRKRLVNDSNQLETIIQSQLSVKLTDLGVMYKQLKAFRHLLETKSPYDPEVTGSSSLGGDVADETHYETVISEQLPYNILLSYLFSYAPNELKSPHQNLDWPPSRYSEWLDKHTGEKERLLVIKSCLESYVNAVKQRRETKFANLYPLLIRLLEKGIQISSN